MLYMHTVSYFGASINARGPVVYVSMKRILRINIYQKFSDNDFDVDDILDDY